MVKNDPSSSKVGFCLDFEKSMCYKPHRISTTTRNEIDPSDLLQTSGSASFSSLVD